MRTGMSGFFQHLENLADLKLEEWEVAVAYTSGGWQGCTTQHAYLERTCSQFVRVGFCGGGTEFGGKSRSRARIAESMDLVDDERRLCEPDDRNESVNLRRRLGFLTTRPRPRSSSSWFSCIGWRLVEGPTSDNPTGKGGEGNDADIPPCLTYSTGLNVDYHLNNVWGGHSSMRHHSRASSYSFAAMRKVTWIRIHVLAPMMRALTPQRL